MGKRSNTTIILIRCASIGPTEVALRDYLALAFGKNVYFVVDNIFGMASLAGEFLPEAIEITRPLINKLGLRAFPRVGWQCGDYAYYAAADALSFDFAWMIEPDVVISTPDPNEFFSHYVSNSSDLVALGLAKRHPRWQWFSTMAPLVAEGGVYGMLFPFSRLSRCAVEHLAKARAAHFSSMPPEKTRLEIPNDEAFTATILVRDGFKTVDMASVVPAGWFSGGTFSTNIPVSDMEAKSANCRNRVMHPVRNAAGAAGKLRVIHADGGEPWAALRRRVINNVGEKAWQRWADKLVGESVTSENPPSQALKAVSEPD